VYLLGLTQTYIHITLKNSKIISYRKQIARQLYTQYVEGNYSNSVTFNSKLGVTET